MIMTYLDWAATAPPLQGLYDTMKEAGERLYGNPASIHEAGRNALEALNKAREICARSLHCSTEHIVFTSCGSESNNMVLFSLLKKRRTLKLITSAVEHPSIHYPALELKKMGIEVLFIPVDSLGRVNLEKLKAAMDADTGMVSIMHVNNETGAIQPIEEIAELIHTVSRYTKRPIHFHTDAVQSLCKLPCLPDSLGVVDSASFSAHKIGGPKGTGMLYLREPLDFLYAGGGQEADLRPGTENVPGISGFAFALSKHQAVEQEDFVKAEYLMDILIRQLSAVPGCSILPEERISNRHVFSPYILNASFPPIPSEVLVRVMSDRGFAISTGSACSSLKAKQTRVLDAMGIPKRLSSSAVRISIGFDTTEEELLSFTETLREETAKLFRILRQ